MGLLIVASIGIIEGLFFLFLFVVLIYLIIRRIRIKETEDFEDRDN